MPDNARGALGSVYRITGDFLRQRGLFDEVKAKLSPESRRLLEKPPFPFAWQSSVPLEEIEKLLHARDPKLPAELGLAAAESLSSTVIAPVLKMALSLFGQTPAALFGNLDRFYSMVVRGFTFEYAAAGPKEGTVKARIEGGRVHASVFAQLRGNLNLIYRLSGATGTVGEPVVLRQDDSGAEITLAVRWD